MPSSMEANLEMPGASATGGEEGPLKENSRKRQEQALMFEKYLEESGLCLSF